MFTGIIETMGTVLRIEKEGTNKHFTIESDISAGLRPDESVSHNGVCLTVTHKENNTHRVTAIEETLIKSNLGDLEEGQKINLERALMYNDRLDGHMVQGHVDQTAVCSRIDERDGSHYFYFEFEPGQFINVEKGSISVNGVSLTVVDEWENGFSVAIIPYTLEHTNFGDFQIGTRVNLEFDIIGKYVSKIMEAYLDREKTKS
jgi:riboflavin synthase